MRTYSYEETLAMLKSAVALKGEDFVYYGDPDNCYDSACYYVKNGEPDCIVGHVLVEVGVKPEDLSFGGRYGHGFAGSVVSMLEEDGVVAFPGKAKALLISVQSRQDVHRPWGESLANAKLVVEGDDEEGYYN